MKREGAPKIEDANTDKCAPAFTASLENEVVSINTPPNRVEK